MNEELLLKLYNKYNLSEKGDFETFKSDMQDLEVAEGFYNKYLSSDKKGTVEQFVTDLGLEYIPMPARPPKYKTEPEKLQEAASRLNAANASLSTATNKLQNVKKPKQQPQDPKSLGYSWSNPSEGAATISTPTRSEQIRSEVGEEEGRLDIPLYEDLGLLNNYERLDRKIKEYEEAEEEADMSLADTAISAGKAAFYALGGGNFINSMMADELVAGVAKGNAKKAKAEAYLNMPLEDFNPALFEETYSGNAYKSTTRDEGVRKTFFDLKKHASRLDEALAVHLEALPEGERNIAIEMLNGNPVEVSEEFSPQLQRVAHLLQAYKTTKDEIKANVTPYENSLKDVTKLIGTYKDQGLSGKEIKVKVLNYLEALKVASPGYEAEKVQDIINIVEDEMFVGGGVDQIPRSIMKTTFGKLFDTASAVGSTLLTAFSTDDVYNLTRGDLEDVQLEEAEQAVGQSATQVASKYGGKIKETTVDKGGVRLVIEDGRVVNMRNPKDGSMIYFPTKEQEEIAKSFDPEKDTTTSDYRGMSIVSATGQVISDMIPMIAISAATGGTTTSVILGSMMTSYGDYYNQALMETGDTKKAAIYAPLVSFGIGFIESKIGNIEARLGRTLRGVEKKGIYDAITKAASETIEDGIETYVKGAGFLKKVEKGIKTSRQLTKDVVDELVEEFSNFPVEAIVGKITDVKSENVSAEELEETAILTTAATIFMSGANMTLQSRNDINELIAYAAQRPEKFNQVADQWIEAAPNEEVKKARRAEIEAKKLAIAEVQDTFSYIQENNFDDKSKDRLTKLTLDKARALYKLNTATSQKTKAVLQQDIDKINKEMAGITPTEPEAVQDTENLGVAPAEEAKPKTFVGRDLTDGKKVYTDFDNTLYNPKTRELTTAGEELRAKLNSGELTPEDVEIITARSADDAEIVRKLFPELSVTTDLSPEGKAAKVAESNGNSIFIDDNKENLEAVKSGEVIDAKTIVPQVPKEVEAEKVAEIKAEEAGGKTTEPVSEPVKTTEPVVDEATDVATEEVTTTEQKDVVLENVSLNNASGGKIAQRTYTKVGNDWQYTEKGKLKTVKNAALIGQLNSLAESSATKDWRTTFEEANPYDKSKVLRTIAESSESDTVLNEVLDKLPKNSPDESNVAWAIANNPNSSKETFERAVSNRALRKGTTDENINSLREKRFPNTVLEVEPTTATTAGEAPASTSRQTPEKIRRQVEYSFDYYPEDDAVREKEQKIVNAIIDKNNISVGAEPMITDAGDKVIWEYNNFDEEGTVSRITFNKGKDGFITSRGATVNKSAVPFRRTKAFEKLVDSRIAEQEKASVTKNEQIQNKETNNQISLKRVEKSKRAANRDNDVIQDGVSYKLPSDVTLFKGKTGKRNPDGTLKTAHPNVKGKFYTMDRGIADEYARNGGAQAMVKIPAGATVEVVNVDQKQSPEKIREAETRAINNSTADVVKLVTMDGKGVEVQYIINPKKTKQDANEKRRPAEVPVGKGSKTSQEVREGDTKGQEVATKSETKKEVNKPNVRELLDTLTSTDTPINVNGFSINLDTGLNNGTYEAGSGTLTREDFGTVNPKDIINIKGGSNEHLRFETENSKPSDRTEEQWNNLKEDIRKNGVKNPIHIIKEKDGRTYISEGNHRLRAAIQVGLDNVPVQITYFGNSQRSGEVINPVTYNREDAKTQKQISTKDVKLKKGEDFDNDRVYEVTYEGETIGRIYYDRSLHNSWLDADYTRTDAKDIFGDVLGTKEEALQAMVDRWNSKQEETPTEVKKEPTKVEEPADKAKPAATKVPDALKDVESTAKALDWVGKDIILGGISVKEGTAAEKKVMGDGIHSIFENGNEVGAVLFSDIDGEKNVVASVFVNEENRKKGVAKKAYIVSAILRGDIKSGELIDGGKTPFVSNEAKKLWDSIIKDFNVKKIKIKGGKFRYVLTRESIAQAYHKAKKDGANPELVKAVEDLLSANQPTTTPTAKPTEEAKDTPTTTTKIEDVKTKGAEVKRTRITTKEKPTTSKEETKVALKEAELKLKDSAKEFFKAFTTGDGKIGIIFDPKAAAISRATAAKNFFGAIVDYVKAKVAAGKYDAAMFLADVKSGKFGDIEINQDGVEYIFDEVLDPGKNREQVKVVEQLRQEIENLYEQFENDSANLDQFEQRVQDIFTDLAKTQKNTRGTNFFFSPSDVKNLLKKASKVTTEEDLNEFNEMLESILEDKKIKKFKEKVDRNRALAKKRVKTLKTTDNDLKNAISFNSRDRSFQSADAKNNYEDVKRFNRFLETVNNPTIAKDKQFLEDKEYFANKYREQQEKAAAKRALKNAEFDKDGNLIEDGEIITPFEKLPKKYKDEFNSRQMKFDEDGNLINDQGKIITPVAELSKKEKAELSKRQTTKKKADKKEKDREEYAEEREGLLEEVDVIFSGPRPIHVDETLQNLSDQFLNLTKADLESLSNEDLSTIISGFKSLRDSGILQDTYEALIGKAKQEAIVNESTKVLEKSSGQFRKLLRDVVLFAKTRGKTAQDLSERFLKRTPLRRVDAIFKGKDGTYFFDTFLNPLAVGFGQFTSFNNRLKKELRELSKNVSQRDSLKLMLYAIDKQYKSNPDSDELLSIEEEIANAEAITDENYKAGDYKLVKEIYEELKKEMGGTFDYRKMDEATSGPLAIKQNERKLIEYIEKLNDSQVGKVLANAARTGKQTKIYNKYTPLDRVSSKTAGTIFKDFVEETLDVENYSLDSPVVPGNVNARVKNQKAIRNWNYVTANYNSAKKTELDYEVRQRLKNFGDYTKGLMESLDEKMSKAKQDGDKAKQAQYKAFKDFIGAMRKTTRDIARDNFVASFDELSDSERVLNFASELGYAATLASVPRSATELISNVWFAMTAYPGEFLSGINYMLSNRDFSGLNSKIDKLITLLPTTQSSRLLDNEGSLYRDQVRETRGFGATVGVGKAKRLLESYTEGVAKFNNGLNSFGDKVIAKPMWFGSFQNEFNKLKKKAGLDEKFDIDRFINDEQYRFENSELVEEATRIADYNLAQGFSSFNPFESIADLKLHYRAGILETFKRFLQRFIRFEYQTAEDALSAMVGRGSMSRGKGLQLMVATAGRMTLYSMLARALGDWFDEFIVRPSVNAISNVVSGNDLLAAPEDDEEEKFSEKIQNSLLGTLISLTLARRLNGLEKVPINLGVEVLNVTFGDELGLRKTPAYNAYENSLVFSTVRIPDIEGFEDEVLFSAFGRDFNNPMIKDMNIYKYLLDFGIGFLGPLNPLASNSRDFVVDFTRDINKDLQKFDDINPYKFDAITESLTWFAGANFLTTIVPVLAPRDVKRNIRNLKSAIQYGPEVTDPVYQKAMEKGATMKEQRDGLDKLSEIRKQHVEKMEDIYLDFVQSDEWKELLNESKEKAGRGSSNKFTTKLLSSKGKYLPERTYYRRGDSWFYEESGDEKTVQSESLLYQLKNRSEKSEYAYAWERFMIEMHKKSFLYQVEPKEISVGEFEFVPRGYKGTKLEQKYGKIAEIPGTTQFSISRFFN